MDRYSDGTYLDSNPDWHDADAVWKAAQITALLRDARVAPRSLCDVGCGAGGVLAALQPLWPQTHMVGFELSPQAVQLATDRHPEVDVRLGEVAGSDDHFELVLLLDVFEHVEDYLGFLRSLAAHGERFVFHIPLDMSAQLLIRSGVLLDKRAKVGHLHYFSKDTALASLSTAGYRVEAWRYTVGTVDVPATTWRAKLLLLPRRVGRKLAPDLTAKLLGGFSALVLATPLVDGRGGG